MTDIVDTAGTLRVAQEIVAGRHDDALSEIVKAVGQRQLAEKTVLCWRIALPDLDLVVTEDDFTVGEAEQVQRETGLTWEAIDPVMSAPVFRAIVVAALVGRHGVDADEARDRVRALPVRAAVDAISYYDAVPIAAGAG